MQICDGPLTFLLNLWVPLKPAVDLKPTAAFKSMCCLLLHPLSSCTLHPRTPFSHLTLWPAPHVLFLISPLHPLPVIPEGFPTLIPYSPPQVAKLSEIFRRCMSNILSLSALTGWTEGKVHMFLPFFWPSLPRKDAALPYTNTRWT